MSRLLEDVLGQADSLAGCIQHLFGTERSRLAKAGELLGKASHVILTGMGSSLYACHPLACFLAENQVRAQIFDTGELLHFYTQVLDGRAPIVLVSRSGETIEILKLLEVIRGRVPTIGVSNVPGSSLLGQVDCPVEIGSGSDQLVAIKTYTASIPALLSLAKAAFASMGDGWRRELDALVVPLDRLVRDCEQSSQELRGFLRTGHAVHLLGRGPSLASALEGSLLFNEVSKNPAVPMSAGNFRHGPVEVVDEGFSAFVFASQPETRALDLALARKLKAVGGQVRVVCGGEVGELDEVTWKLPQCSGLLSPVLEIAPVQLAAYRLAEWRGITPGDFRIAAAVTRSEEKF